MDFNDISVQSHTVLQRYSHLCALFLWVYQHEARPTSQGRSHVTSDGSVLALKVCAGLYALVVCVCVCVCVCVLIYVMYMHYAFNDILPYIHVCIHVHVYCM